LTQIEKPLLIKIILMLRKNLKLLSATPFIFYTFERISISPLHPFLYDSFSLPPCQLEILTEGLGNFWWSQFQYSSPKALYQQYTTLFASI